MKVKSKNINKQKGVALFVTLLVVTIATLLATEIWFNNTLDVSRQYNNRSAYQAKHYANGMALWAKDVLRLDYEESGNFDNKSEPWNQVIAGIELEDAVLSGRLTDLDSKFNLNNLVIEGEVHEKSHELFIRILNNLELDFGIADKIIDWLDANQSPRTQGAEDNVYLSKSPSYRTAGQYFQHISELKLIDGMDDNTYERLKSFVTVLPVFGNQPSKININTASSLLLKSLDDRIQTKEALILYSDGNASNKTIDDFFNQAAIQIYRLGDDQYELRTLIDTQSRWYEAQIGVKMENSIFQSYALVYRPGLLAVIKQWSETALN